MSKKLSVAFRLRRWVLAASEQWLEKTPPSHHRLRRHPRRRNAAVSHQVASLGRAATQRHRRPHHHPGVSRQNGRRGEVPGRWQHQRRRRRKLSRREVPGGATLAVCRRRIQKTAGTWKFDYRFAFNAFVSSRILLQRNGAK